MEKNFNFSTGAHIPTPQYGYYLMHVYSHITLAVAVMDSWGSMITTETSCLGLCHADESNEDKTAVHGLRKVMAILRSWYMCFSAEINIGIVQ